jgi:subfamily B ATP-binding cassette protein MsbA
MNQIKSILSLTDAFKSRRAQYILFNILAAIFSVFSIGMLIPFLKVIFSSDQIIAAVEPAFSWQPSEFMSYLDYHLRVFIGEQGALTSLYYFSIGIILMFLFKNLFNYLSFFNIAYVRSGVVRNLRAKVYNKTVDLPLAHYSDERKGDIISRVTNDVKEVEWGVVGAIEMVFKHPFYILFYLISLFLLSWQMTLFTMIVLPISGYLISRLGKRLKTAAGKSQAKLGEVVNAVEETLAGLKVIKAFNAESRVKRSFDKVNQEHFNFMVKLHRKELSASPVSEFLGSVVIAMLLMFGGQLVLSDNVMLDGEYFIAYIVLFSQLITPAKALTESYFRIQKASASMNRLDDILNADLRLVEANDPLPVNGLKEGIEYREVSFSYDQDPVLENINFVLPKGKTTALVGASGGGKSTIADLLPRFHDIKSGSILLDGVDIRSFRIKDLRNLMGIVSQEPVLFNTTVKENLLLGREHASEEDMITAAKIANAHDFIMQLEEGYETGIGDRGGKLSGGQRQRIAIARAVLSDPEILILDEATSALDTESEKLVQEALENLMKGRTVLVIAHRLSTVKHADEILVIDKGQIAERGSHEVLASNGGIYSRLYELQNF